jgi:hypothetical protein
MAVCSPGEVSSERAARLQSVLILSSQGLVPFSSLPRIQSWGFPDAAKLGLEPVMILDRVLSEVQTRPFSVYPQQVVRMAVFLQFACEERSDDLPLQAILSGRLASPEAA